MDPDNPIVWTDPDVFPNVGPVDGFLPHILQMPDPIISQNVNVTPSNNTTWTDLITSIPVASVSHPIRKYSIAVSWDLPFDDRMDNNYNGISLRLIDSVSTVRASTTLPDFIWARKNGKHSFLFELNLVTSDTGAPFKVQANVPDNSYNPAGNLTFKFFEWAEIKFDGFAASPAGSTASFAKLITNVEPFYNTLQVETDMIAEGEMDRLDQPWVGMNGAFDMCLDLDTQTGRANLITWAMSSDDDENLLAYLANGPEAFTAGHMTTEEYYIVDLEKDLGLPEDDRDQIFASTFLFGSSLDTVTSTVNHQSIPGYNMVRPEGPSIGGTNIMPYLPDPENMDFKRYYQGLQAFWDSSLSNRLYNALETPSGTVSYQLTIGAVFYDNNVKGNQITYVTITGYECETGSNRFYPIPKRWHTPIAIVSLNKKLGPNSVSCPLLIRWEFDWDPGASPNRAHNNVTTFENDILPEVTKRTEWHDSFSLDAAATVGFPPPLAKPRPFVPFIGLFHVTCENDKLVLTNQGPPGDQAWDWILNNSYGLNELDNIVYQSAGGKSYFQTLVDALPQVYGTAQKAINFYEKLAPIVEPFLRKRRLMGRDVSTRVVTNRKGQKIAKLYRYNYPENPGYTNGLYEWKPKGERTTHMKYQ